MSTTCVCPEIRVNREPRTEIRDSRLETRDPRSESREPRAESREPRAESREPRAESREPSPETQELGSVREAGPFGGSSAWGKGARESRIENRDPRSEPRDSRVTEHACDNYPDEYRSTLHRAPARARATLPPHSHDLRALAPECELSTPPQ